MSGTRAVSQRGGGRLEDLVISTVARWPDALAVSGPDGYLTYGELDRLADRLAGRLREVGVRRGDRVALWFDRSGHGIAAMQAVLRLGGAYVPIDPHAPARRVTALLADCAASAVVTTQDRQERLAAALPPGRPPAVLYLDAAPPGDGHPAQRVRCAEAGPDDLAYILYTSGSTGEPKGVCVSHHGSLAFVRWAGDLLEITAADRLANHAPFQFDLSVFDLYAAFRAGASVHLVPDRATAAALTDFLDRESISIWYSVPSALVLMMEYGRLLRRELPRLRAVIFAGEVFPIGPLRQLRRRRPDLTLLNFYGPTETNVCAFHRVGEIPADQTSPVPIGTTACGDRLRAVRPDGSEAAPGEEGELVVEGPTVMIGYYGRPPQHGTYRTGDFVRRRADDVFEYVGRRDHLVKVRGYRVELGEIESALLAHPDVVEAVVVVSGTAHRARLAAFVVPRGGLPLSSIDVRRYLAELLPRQLIVDRVHCLDRMPRNSNGKTDRQHLREMTEMEPE